MLYDLYMEEFISEAVTEMVLYQESHEYLTEDKEGVYKTNYYMRDNLQNKYISPVLSKSSGQDSIVEFVGKFIDDHSAQLSTAGPVFPFTFSTKEAGVLYDIFGVNGEQLIELYNKMIVETYYGKVSPFFTAWFVNAPHKLLITSILMEAVQKGYSDIIECCEYMWAFSEYALLYREFWSTGVNEEVMKYTIEHLGSKYIVTQMKTIQGLLKYDSHSAVSAHMTDLKRGVDNVYIDLAYRMRNQIKNKFKNISRAYYVNIKKNATQHSKDSQFDDGSIADVEGHITNIAQTVDRTINRFSTGSINAGIAKIAADGSNVDKDTLIGYLNQIMAVKDNKSAKFIENVITAYFNKNPTSESLGSTEFLNFGIMLFRSISTSKDELYQELRQILNFWMYDIIDLRQFYKSDGTISNYNRAVFNYMIFMINHYN